MYGHVEQRIVATCKSFLEDEESATTIEWGLLATLIAVFMIGVVTILGTTTASLFDRVLGRTLGGGN
jgi:Flp pilus assembly pilin Flp